MASREASPTDGCPEPSRVAVDDEPDEGGHQGVLNLGERAQRGERLDVNLRVGGAEGLDAGRQVHLEVASTPEEERCDFQMGAALADEGGHGRLEVRRLEVEEGQTRADAPRRDARLELAERLAPARCPRSVGEEDDAIHSALQARPPGAPGQ